MDYPHEQGFLDLWQLQDLLHTEGAQEKALQDK